MDFKAQVGTVTQASSQWRQLVRSLQTSFRSIDWRALLHSLERFRGPGGWLGGFTILVVLLLWNWQLVAATGIGLLTMLLMYGLQQDRWQPGWNWQRLWNRSNRQLTLTVASGSIATISTYMATTVWLKSADPWLATGTVLQGLGTLSVLLLMIWQRFDRSPHQTDYHQILASLAEPDPLKRLIAVRQATRWANLETVSSDITPQCLDGSIATHLIDCFVLMLNQETEPTICNALLDGLRSLSDGKDLADSRTMAMPIALQQPEVELYPQDSLFD